MQEVMKIFRLMIYPNLYLDINERDILIEGELTMMKRYYLAYGSNLNLEQMKKRCPKHKVVGMMLLEGYELLFRKYLTVRKNADSVVPVGIFELD